MRVTLRMPHNPLKRSPYVPPDFSFWCIIMHYQQLKESTLKEAKKPHKRRNWLFMRLFSRWRGRDSNSRPCDYESHALTG